tara:strand:+ start:843 stop:1874 length:1032 start_codon:yes stop_codon:yes gene_type:complete
MRVINARNINDALLMGIDLFQHEINYRTQESRNGTTYEALQPITTVYNKPWERVLLLPERDCNPFFHFIEGLWMLAGRRDLEPLTYFVKSMKNFSDDDETLWGAYGWRWQSYFNKDQLPIIIEMLKKNPDDRRCVLQMWDPITDLGRDGKDVPCNTNIYFKIRDNALQMTICCRSNDMLWGAYGANAVHMSMLQEYMAIAIGVKMGKYYQISDSFHVYQNDVWDRVKHLKLNPLIFRSKIKNPYENLEENTPLITNMELFEPELERLFEYNFEELIRTKGWVNPAFKDIAVPMLKVYAAHKKKDYKTAHKELRWIKPRDWKEACSTWIDKREENYKNKGEDSE